MIAKLNEVINVKWILRENVVLKIEDGKIPFRTFTIARLLYRQIPEYTKADKANFLLATLQNIERRTVYTWLKNDFNPKKCYPSYYKKYIDSLPGAENEKFKITVLNKGKVPKVIDEVVATIAKIEGAVFGDVPDNKPDINLNTVLEKRKDEIAQLPPLQFDNIETMEDLVVRMCEDFATGLITITEACAKHGLVYLQFLQIIATSEHCRRVYEKACRYAGMIQNSRQLTLVDQMIINLLSRGKCVTEQMTFEKHLIPGQLEARWIEKKKTVTTRDISPAEVITLKMMLQKSQYLTTSETMNEFSTMSEHELMEYVAKNSTEIQTMLTTNPVRDVITGSSEFELH